MEKTGKTVEELIDKSQKALENPKLVEIVKTAQKNKDGRVNLSDAYDRAFEHVYGETKDLKKAKELAVSTRWLAMLRRDYEEKFEKLFIQEGAPQPENEMKGPFRLEEIEFELPLLAEIALRVKNHLYGGEKQKYTVRFAADIMPGLDDQCAYRGLEEFCIKVLRALSQTEVFGSTEKIPLANIGYEGKRLYDGLRDCFIQILEEKFGLKVKNCFTCTHSKMLSCLGGGQCICYAPYNDRCGPLSIVQLECGCKHWAPKEKEVKVEEKEKVCRTCACGIKRVGADPDKNESYMCGGNLLKQCAVSGQCEQWEE